MPRVLLLCVLLLLSSSAFAQRSVSIDRFTPPLDADGFLGVQGTRTPGDMRPSFGVFLDYASSILTVEPEAGGQRTLVDDHVSHQLSVELGLGNRAALALALPMVLSQHGESLSSSDPALPDSAMADPRASARYRLFGESGSDRAGSDGPGIALQVDVLLPMGQRDAFAGEGAARVEGQLLADFHVLGAGAGVELGLRHRFHERQLFDRRLRDEFLFGAALKLPVPPLAPLAALVEVRGASDFGSSATTMLEGELGVHLPLADGVVSLALGRRLVGGIGAPELRVVLGLWYRLEKADADGDGVFDQVDQCPPLPEDLDGFQDEDGCPDPDNDNDLIPDADDLCPNDEALEGRDEDEDGCTDPP